jgi:hypothetical protein
MTTLRFAIAICLHYSLLFTAFHLWLDEPTLNPKFSCWAFFGSIECKSWVWPEIRYTHHPPMEPVTLKGHWWKDTSSVAHARRSSGKVICFLIHEHSVWTWIPCERLRFISWFRSLSFLLSYLIIKFRKSDLHLDTLLIVLLIQSQIWSNSFEVAPWFTFATTC